MFRHRPVVIRSVSCYLATIMNLISHKSTNVHSCGKMSKFQVETAQLPILDGYMVHVCCHLQMEPLEFGLNLLSARI